MIIWLSAFSFLSTQSALQPAQPIFQYSRCTVCHCKGWSKVSICCLLSALISGYLIPFLKKLSFSEFYLGCKSVILHGQPLHYNWTCLLWFSKYILLYLPTLERLLQWWPSLISSPLFQNSNELWLPLLCTVAAHCRSMVSMAFLFSIA